MDEIEGAPPFDKRGLFEGCVRLPAIADSDELRREVEGLPTSAWDSPAERLGVHRAAGALFLRGYAPAEGEKPIVDRDALGGLPSCRALINRLAAKPMRALLARLPGGALIPSHCDVGEYFESTIRLHIPIITHSRVWMVCDGLSYQMAAGEIWALNNSRKHAVWNAHPTKARTHLILDVLPDPNIMALLQGGEPSLGRRLQHVDDEISTRTRKRDVHAGIQSP